MTVIEFPKRPGLERVLSVRELADVLGMSERWVAYQVRAGMPSYKFGRARRFRLSEVERWLSKEEAS